VNVADANAEIVRRAYQARNETDFEALARLFDEKACWHTPGRSRMAGCRLGRDRVIAQFAYYAHETGGAFQVALQNVLASEDGCALGVHHMSAERNGKRLDLGCCVTLHVKNGRILSGRDHFFDLYEWDAFWA
jgi:ketosteroid isomerase-like protein